MSLHIYKEIEQGSDEWFEHRCGIVTASVVGQLITAKQPTGIVVRCPECDAWAGDPCVSLSRKDRPAIKTLHPSRQAPDDAPPILEVADNDTSRGLTAHLAAERITGHVEESYTSRDMERGILDEPYAREVYAEHYAPVEEVGFMVNDGYGFKVGYSPDGLVGDDGLIEIKSRRQKVQLKTIMADEVPAENMAQLQCGLYVSERKWIDYVSYCGGMPLYVKRVYPDPAWQEVIQRSIAEFEGSAEAIIRQYKFKTENSPATERIDHFPELEF